MEELVTLRQSTGAARCVECGKCTSMCPLAAWCTFSARRIMGQDLEEELAGRGEGAVRCLTCSSCEVRCPQGVHFTDFVRGLRSLLPEEHRPRPPHDGIFQSVARAMTNGHPPRRPADWLGEDLEIATEGEVGLFVGCLPFFDFYFEDDLGAQTQEIARSAVRLLNEVGISPVIVDEERCCGHDLLWSGDREAFATLARANAKSFAERGIKHLVTACAECCRTWRLDYPEFSPDYQPKVEHLAEFLAPRIEKGELTFNNGAEATLTFQDPCRLGRHLNQTDAPRQALAGLPGVSLVEMQRSGRDALCCGTSGFIHCDAVSRSLQAARLEEAAATGAQTLVTACPKCLIHFNCALNEDRRRDRPGPQIQIQDFAVVAASRLATNGAKKASAPAGARREEGEME